MRRFKHSLSHYVLTTFDMGKLVPVGWYEVLPGDSVRQATSSLIRFSPLMTPVMHPITVRIHHWFVPFRLLYDAWESFITGGNDGEGDGSAAPVFTGLNGLAGTGTLLNYLGVPSGIQAATAVSRFPVRAYNMIFNEFYRDQDLVTEVDQESFVVQDVAWEKDRFTAARPWSQRGPDVTIPLEGRVTTSATEHTTGAAVPEMMVRIASTGGVTTGNQGLRTEGGAAGGLMEATGNAPTGGTASTTIYPSNLVVTEGLASINDFRLAFALQRYQEARAQYGTRYTEYLRYLGVRSSDARLQRPEYLGGGRSTMNISEVLKTGEGDTPDEEAPIGELRGHGIGALRSRRFIRFFEEHGLVMSLASIRPRSMYTTGIDRKWSRRTKEDYWQRELEQIGQQAVLNKEVYAGAASPEGTFGYNDRYYEYRHEPSIVTGEFQTTLNDWHLARIFGSEPALNQSFTDCDPSKRIFAEQTQHSCWAMFSHSIQARRMVGHKTIGRLM